MYRDWRMCCFNLHEYLYRHVRIEVMISDCYNDGIHFGYCYFAGDCEPMTTVVNGCNAGPGDTVGYAKAPDRMQAYQWYRSNIGVTESLDLNNYTLLPGATDSMQAVRLEDFMSRDGADTLLHRNTFLCKMTSYLNPAKPLQAEVLATVGNMKPILYLDTFPDCDRNITLWDRSRVVYDDGHPENRVDTSRTEWEFYEGEEPEGMPVHVHRGGSASYHYSTPGLHSVVVRTYSYRTDTLCWNEKPAKIHSLAPPTICIELSDQDICRGDSVAIYNCTPEAAWHRWVLQQGDSIVADTITPDSVLSHRPYYDTTHITLHTHTPFLAYADTNMDGILDPHYCINSLDTVLRVIDYPRITMAGDSIVCNGTPAIVTAAATDKEGRGLAECSFAWYAARHDSIPIAESDTLTTDISSDTLFYVAVTANGCTAWDSVALQFVNPILMTEKTLICTGDPVMLYGSGADSCTWSCEPDDPSLQGQEHNDTIVVAPRRNTTYTLVGYGSNGCSATPVTSLIATQDYPHPHGGHLAEIH